MNLSRSYVPTAVPEGRILVTGAAGFIGSALVWALNRAGHDDIIVCDRLNTSQKYRNLVPLRFRDYIEADDMLQIAERDGLRALGAVRTVIHLGACSATTQRDTLYLYRTNYEFTKRLAAATLADDSRFVYASSAATYGLREDLLSESLPLETLRPVNMYAYSKHLFDCYAAREGLDERIVGVKYFNVFGPNEAHKGEMRSVVAKAFEQLQTEPSVRLFRSLRPEFADGEQRRDFIYVVDAVDATLALAANPDAQGIYNIGSGIASTWKELITQLFLAMDRRPAIEFVDMPEALRGSYQYTTCASLARLRGAGYEREITPLQAAIADYLPYLRHDGRLDPIPVREHATA